MKCPGQDTRYWTQEAIFQAECPQCGREVEFFKDDTTRKCGACGHKFVNPKMDFGCAAYCKFAEQCLGDIPPEALAQRARLGGELLKQRVAVEMKRYFGRDFKRIGHAADVAKYAERIYKEEGGDPAVIMCSAYLHDIGIHEAERKHNSTAARYQHLEGPPIARGILEALGAQPALIDEVCDIVGHHHHPRAEETLNFKVIFDADLIVNLEEEVELRAMDEDRTEKIITKSFLTTTGKRLARERFLGESHESEKKNH